jgi:hypothetical protein
VIDVPDWLRRQAADSPPLDDELPVAGSAPLAAVLVQFAQQPARLRFDVFGALELCSLGDARRNKRELTLLAAMIQGYAQHRSATTGACHAPPWPHAMSSFRFYNNHAIGLPALYQGLQLALQPLLPVGARAYVAHDLSLLDFSAHNAKDDRIPIGNGRGRGYELYSALVLDAAGRPLGPAVQELRTSQGVLSSLPPGQRPDPLAGGPGYAFDSHYAQVQRGVAALRTLLPERELVHVLDAEFDELELQRFFSAAPERWLIRAFQFRRRVSLRNGRSMSLGQACGRASLQLRGEVERQGQTFDLWTGETTVFFDGLSRRGVKAGKALPKAGAPVEVRVVIAELRRAGKVAHRWVLLTQLTEPLDQLVQVYLWRWRVERLFFFTKVGMKIEQWQQQTGERIARRLAVASLAAMVLYQLEGATEPEFVALRKWIATRGGWLGRKQDAIGPLVLMRGMATLIGALALLEQMGTQGVQQMGRQLSRLLGLPLPGIAWPPDV